MNGSSCWLCIDVIPSTNDPNYLLLVEVGSFISILIINIIDVYDLEKLYNFVANMFECCINKYIL